MNDTPDRIVSQSNNEDFETLKDVEFAGDQLVEKSEEDETEPAPEELTLDEKVTRLRAPFEADEAVRVTYTNNLSQWKIDSDTRAEELESIRKRKIELEEELGMLSDEITDRQRKFTSRLQTRLGKRDEKVVELASKRRAVQEELYELDKREMDIDRENKNAEYDLELLYREPDCEENPEPLSVEQKEQLLSPDALSELSLEEYIALWRRLNPFYASHVTRQGVRDHNAMIYHCAYMSEFQSGFTEMLEQGKAIHSGAEVHYGISEGFTEEDVHRALEIALPDYERDIDEGLEEGKDPEDMANWFVDHLPMNYTWASAEPWSDINAIHFGRNTCLDDTYGAEKGNEVFYVFPIDVIASQNRFGGHLGRNFSTAQVNSERKWNDMFVWSESGRIPLDSGIVFLPKSAQVSPETGSVYETVESVNGAGETIREPFLDEEIVQNLTKAVETLEREGFYDPEENSFYGTMYDRERREAFRERLENEFNLPEEIVEHVINGNRDLIRSPKEYAEDGSFIEDAKKDGFDLDALSQEEKFRLSIRYNLERRAMGLKKAEETISAEAYWNGYFEEHPEQRPKHIVFYDGDPSEAVDEFLIENNIAKRVHHKSDTVPNLTGPGDTHEQDGDWLGYDDHMVINPEEDEHFNSEHERFNEIARRQALPMILERQKKLQQKHEDAK